MRDLNRLIKKVSGNGTKIQAVIFDNVNVVLNYTVCGALVHEQGSAIFDNIAEARCKIGEVMDKYHIPERNCNIIEFTGGDELIE